jgi:RHS repeat-associated protein
VTHQPNPIFIPATPEQYGYDADGNLTSDGRWVYTYDAENRVIAIQTNPATLAANSAVPNIKLIFTYDYLGRRVKKMVYHWNASTSSYVLAYGRKFVYDGWNMVAELTHDDSLVNRYTWGLDISGTLQGAGGIGGLLFIKKGMSTRPEYPVYDGNGNVVALRNSAEYQYDPFGRLLTERTKPERGIENPFRFSTKYTDAETGLVYFGYRFYNPDTARWLTRDPIEESGGANLYEYCSNEPVGRYDPLGEWGPDIHREATTRWAKTLKYSKISAEAIGDADEKVDSGGAPLTNWGYHFDANYGAGKDSRLENHDTHVTNAIDACRCAMGNDDPLKAVNELGTALHPLQDWVAHADYFVDKTIPRRVIHNAGSPQTAFGPSPSKYPDDWLLDVDGSPDGRAVTATLHPTTFMKMKSEYAIYRKGSSRYRMKHTMTTASLSQFYDFVARHGGCRCRLYFFYGIVPK